MLEQQENEEEMDQVQLLTLHAAKGLEFKHVFVIGVEEDILPHRNSADEDSLQEERRLAYVGITRAQQSLTLSYAKKRTQHGKAQRCEPSRFLDELPNECIQWPQRDGLTPEQSKERAEKTMSSLHALFE